MGELLAMPGHNCKVGRQYPNRQMRRRMYAAAKTNRLTGDWIPADQSINDLIRTSSPRIRARVRQLVRDFPYFKRASDVLVDYTIGSAMNFQSRVMMDEGDKQTPDLRARKQIEDAVKYAMEEMDVAGRLHYNEMRPLSKRQENETGNYLYVKRYLKDKNRYIPFALQAYEVDWLTDMYAKVADGNVIDQGVEYSADTGRTVAYHFADPQNIRKPVRVVTELVIHGFETLRPGQLVGVSPFTTAVLIANDLSNYIDATIDTAKLAAKYLAIVTTSNAADFQRQRTQDGEGDDEGKKLEELENAIIEYLKPGEEIEFAKNDTVGGTFDPFTKFILRMLAVATGVTYELLSGDYSGLSYSNLKTIRSDMFRMFQRPFNRHTRQMDQPVVREIIEQAVFAGRIDLPGYFANPRKYWEGVFIAPGSESPDRLRDSKADTTEIANLTLSPQEVVARRGRDFDTVLDEIEEARDKAAARGLSLGDVSTALGNNPAKLGAAEEGDSSSGRDGVDADTSDTVAADPDQVKKEADAYGVAVRAGAVTPQETDEESFRVKLNLPDMSQEVKDAWESDGGTRRPITLQSGETFEANQDSLTGDDIDTDEDKDDPVEE